MASTISEIKNLNLWHNNKLILENFNVMVSPYLPHPQWAACDFRLQQSFLANKTSDCPALLRCRGVLYFQVNTQSPFLRKPHSRISCSLLCGNYCVEVPLGLSLHSETKWALLKLFAGTFREKVSTICDVPKWSPT